MSEEIRNRTIRLMQQYSVAPQKKFSQNFLVDDAAVKKIVDSVPFDQSKEVVEIGPGLGSLTFELVARAEHVTAIDFDRDMVKVLNEELKEKNVSIMQEDFLKTDLRLFHVKQASYIGNLPYEITRDIIQKVLCDNDFIYFGFMVQKDLVDKLIYQEGSSLNNPYSVFLALRGTVRVLMDLNPGSFYPSPKVASSFLVFKPSDSSFASIEVFNLLKSFFSNPRKNLNNNLRGNIYSSLIAKLPKVGIPLSKRPHELTIDEWKVIINTFLKG
jgi:16S rRNA (adenine1518-N6/adenine1519-N6)-dimethyltransferase